MSTKTNSQTTFKAPKIGCKHFRSVVKDIRADNNTLFTALCDIIDNIYGIASVLNIVATCNIQIKYDENSNLYKIIISDNILHGFKAIFSEETDNPLNMGHIRTGHEDDSESSEFGTGFKKALIFLSQYAEIYTRSVKDDSSDPVFVKVVFDIPEMSGRQCPSESYEPTEFEIIDENTFKKHHPYQEGSSIILKNLKPTDAMYNVETGNRLTPVEFEDILREHLGKVYRELIDVNITISVNDIMVEAQYDLLQMVPESNKKMCTFHVELDNNNEPREVYRENISNGRSYVTKFDATTSKFNKSVKQDFDAFVKKPSIVPLDLTSLTTKKTIYEHIVSGDITDIVRGGRDFGESKITKQEKDGYSNHIYHRINYKSKKLNPIIGVGSNKRVNIKSNMLMTAIHVTEKERTKQFRKFCKEGTIDPDSDSEDSIISSATDTKRSSKSKSKTNKKAKSTSSSKKSQVSLELEAKNMSSSSSYNNNVPSVVELLQNHSSSNISMALEPDPNEESGSEIEVNPNSQIETETETETKEVLSEESKEPLSNKEHEIIKEAEKLEEDEQEEPLSNKEHETIKEAEKLEEDEQKEQEDALTISLDKIVQKSYASWTDFWEQNENIVRLFINQK